jgi:hypothetical protein
MLAAVHSGADAASVTGRTATPGACSDARVARATLGCGSSQCGGVVHEFGPAVPRPGPNFAAVRMHLRAHYCLIVGVRNGQSFIASQQNIRGCCGLRTGWGRGDRHRLLSAGSRSRSGDIDTNFNVYTPPVRLENPPGNAYASVVLMTGGNGLLSLDATGTIIDSTGNFLIRTANLFLQHGLNVMMADVALAYPAPNGMTLSDRLSSTHVVELQGFINAAMIRWGKPVWVVGTSNGSVSAVTAAGFTSALSGLRGVVLTSTVTQLSAADQPTFNLYVSRITVPTLVVWNQDDHCTASPPSGSAALFAAIPSSNKASDVLEGGHSVATDPCGAFSEHGLPGPHATRSRTSPSSLNKPSDEFRSQQNATPDSGRRRSGQALIFRLSTASLACIHASNSGRGRFLKSG